MKTEIKKISNKIPERVSWKTVIAITVLSIISTSAIWYTFGVNSSTSVISEEKCQGSWTYTIWRSGSKYYAKDENGLIQFRHTDANATGFLINVFNALQNGDSVLLKKGIYLLMGSYNYDSNIFDLTQCRITIAGEGWGSIIKLDNDSTQGTDGARILYLHGDGCILKDFAIDGNYQNQGSINEQRDGFNIHIDGNNCMMINVFSCFSTGDGVEFSGTGTIIQNCMFIENWEHDIHANSAHDAIIDDNILEREINNGMISLWCQEGFSTEKIIISNNILRGGSTDGIHVGGEGTVSNVIISNNVIQGITGYGIKIGDQNEVTNIKITGNIIRSTTNDGIQVRRGEGIEITDNKIAHCDTHGVSIIVCDTTKRIVIANNQIYDNNQDDTGKSGIYISNANLNVDYLTIRSNQINSCGNPKHNYGINIGSGGTGNYSHAYIHDNYIFGCATSAINEGKSFTDVTDNSS